MHCIVRLTQAHTYAACSRPALRAHTISSPPTLRGFACALLLPQDILQRDPALNASLTILPEECAVHVHHESVTYEQARYLACMYRANLESVARPRGAAAADAATRSPAATMVPPLPEGCRVLPLAALLTIDPVSSRPVLLHILEEPAAVKSPRATSASGLSAGAGAAASSGVSPATALEWYRRYTEGLLNAGLRLWCCYGVTLELHGQNTLVVLDARGMPHRIVCREVAGGAYCYEALLLANGVDIRAQLHPRQDAVFADSGLPLGILFHAVFCQHLLPLADALCSVVSGARHAELISSVRAGVAATLRRCASEHAALLQPGDAHLAAFFANLEATEHALLHTREVRAKGLLHMRALGTKSELFVEARNPLLLDDEIEEEGGSNTSSSNEGGPSGRVCAFPLPWRALDEVAGCGRGMAKL